MSNVVNFPCSFSVCTQRNSGVCAQPSFCKEQTKHSGLERHKQSLSINMITEGRRFHLIACGAQISTTFRTTELQTPSLIDLYRNGVTFIMAGSLVHLT